MLESRLKELREQKGIPQRKVASELDIDTATYSKIENGLLLLKKEHIAVLEKYYQLKENTLAKLWLADKICHMIKDEETAKEALKIVIKKYE